MWQRLSKTKRILIAVSLLMFAVIALAISITYTYFAKITTASLNQLLAPYQTQITTLSITPNALFQGKVGAITLDVNGNIIHIDKLQVALRDEIVWRSPSLADIKSIAVDNIEVSLSPTLFTELAKNKESNDPQSFSMHLGRLPLIAVGKARLNFAEIENEQLHLELNYLNLDQQGRFFSALSLQGKPLFNVQAKLTPEQWQAQTQLSLDSLNHFVATLIELKREQLQKAKLTPAELKQGQSDLQKALPQMAVLAQIINQFKPNLGGTIASNITLDLNTNQISSTHQWFEPKLAITKVETQPLENPIELAPKQPLAFALSGALDALQLNIEPMQLDLQLTPQQQAVLINSTLEDAQLKQTLTQLIAALAPTSKTQDAPNINLNLQLSQQVNYQLANQQLSLPELQLTLELATEQKSNGVTASLTDLHFHSEVDNYELMSLWQLELNQHSPFCVTQKDESFSFSQNCHNTTEMQISYQQLDLQLAGVLKLKSAALKSEADSLVSSITIHPKSQLTLNAPRFVQHHLYVTAEQIAAEMQSETTLSNFNQLHLGQSLLTINGNQLQLTQTENSETQRLNIGSQQTQLQLANAQLDISDDNMTKLSLGKFTAQTFAPELTLFQQGDIEPVSRIISDAFTLTSSDNIKLQLDKTEPTHLANIKGMIPPISLRLDNSQFSQNLADNKKLTTDIATVSLSSTGISETTANQIDDKQPTAFISQPWKTQLHFNIADLKHTEHYFLLGKQRARQLMQLNEFNVDQQLDWQPTAQHTQLRSHANWSLDDIHFNTQHQLALSHPVLSPNNKGQTSAQIEGSLDFSSDINLLVNQLQRNFKLNMPLNAIGDLSVHIQHQLSWTPNIKQINVQVTPKLDIEQGDISQLPFEQMNLTGQCQFELLDSPSKQADNFGCPDLALSIQAFNPGVLLTHIEGKAQIDMENTLVGMRAKDNKKNADIDFTATADTLGGKLLLPQFDLNLNAPSHAYLILQGLELQQLMEIQPQVGVYADGVFDGVLPVALDEGKVSVNGGKLAARAPGGLIKVEDNPAVTQMRLSQPYLDFAFSALEELHYNELSTRFDMDKNGDALLKVNIKGQAKDIERPIHLNYTQEENMLQLLKSLQIGDTLQSQIENAMGQ